MAQPPYPFFDFSRSGFKVASDMVKSALESAAGLRHHQLAATKESLASHAQVVAVLDNAKDFEEMVAVPGQLANIQFRAMVSYWNGFYQLASENQTDVARRIQTKIGQNRENFQRMLGVGTDGSIPMLTALQPLANLASTMYELSARATEETAKLTAARLATANGGVRGSSGNGYRKAA